MPRPKSQRSVGRPKSRSVKHKSKTIKRKSRSVKRKSRSVKRKSRSVKKLYGGGIQNECIICYGIEFEYNEIKELKDSKEFKELAERIDSDDMPNLWQEMGFITACNYEDEESCSYIIGIQLKDNLTLHDFIKQIDVQKIKDIKNECKKYNLTYKTPKIICRSNVV